MFNNVKIIKQIKQSKYYSLDLWSEVLLVEHWLSSADWFNLFFCNFLQNVQILSIVKCNYYLLLVGSTTKGKPLIASELPPLSHLLARLRFAWTCSSGAIAAFNEHKSGIDLLAEVCQKCPSHFQLIRTGPLTGELVGQTCQRKRSHPGKCNLEIDSFVYFISLKKRCTLYFDVQSHFLIYKPIIVALIYHWIVHTDR